MSFYRFHELTQLSPEVGIEKLHYHFFSSSDKFSVENVVETFQTLLNNWLRGRLGRSGALFGSADPEVD